MWGKLRRSVRPAVGHRVGDPGVRQDHNPYGGGRLVPAPSLWPCLEVRRQHLCNAGLYVFGSVSVCVFVSQFPINTIDCAPLQGH